jgi:DegV family protein with EDD domain
MIGIVTDSNSQLPAELQARYGVEVVPLTVVVDGVDHEEGVDLDADRFYGLFADGRTPAVSTAQPSPGRFAQAYEQVAARGATEILSIHIGSAISGTLNSARLAAAGAPVPVRLVDTGTSSFGIACCVWEAGEAVARGASIDEAAAIAEATAATIGNVFIVKALDLARAGGRVVVAEDDAAAGAIPVLSLVGSDLQVVGQVRDVDEAAHAMAAFATRPGLGSALRVAVGIADRAAEPLWTALEDELRAHPSVVDLVRYRVGPSVGAHTGPGTAGAFFYPASGAP